MLCPLVNDSRIVPLKTILESSQNEDRTQFQGAVIDPSKNTALLPFSRYSLKLKFKISVEM
jgi:hypothetical protein